MAAALVSLCDSIGWESDPDFIGSGGQCKGQMENGKNLVF